MQHTPQRTLQRTLQHTQLSCKERREVIPGDSTLSIIGRVHSAQHTHCNTHRNKRRNTHCNTHDSPAKSATKSYRATQAPQSSAELIVRNTHSATHATTHAATHAATQTTTHSATHTTHLQRAQESHQGTQVSQSSAELTARTTPPQCPGCYDPSASRTAPAPAQLRGCDAARHADVFGH